jgi:hypothetical protein
MTIEGRTPFVIFSHGFICTTLASWLPPPADPHYFDVGIFTILFCQFIISHQVHLTVQNIEQFE